MFVLNVEACLFCDVEACLFCDVGACLFCDVGACLPRQECQYHGHLWTGQSLDAYLCMGTEREQADEWTCRCNCLKGQEHSMARRV
jgi:hypothetical protein